MCVTWAAVATISVVGGYLFEEWGLPAPHLFIGLLVGLAVALTGTGRQHLRLPARGYVAAQAVAGVLLGTYFNPASISTIAGAWAPLLLVTFATLSFSIACGILLSRTTGLDLATSTLGLIAGGSAGIIASSDEMRADARLVAFMQYFRLAAVVVTAPLLVRFVLAPSSQYEALGPQEIEATGSLLRNGVFTIVVAALGAWLGTRSRLPAGALIGPLLLAALASVYGPFQGLTSPEILRETAFVAIGLHVGLRMDWDTVRRAKPLLLPIVVATAVLLVTCGLFGWVLSLATDFNPLTAYLATTPGGINAVMVVAFASGADTTLVFAVQTLRLFLIVLLAPLLVSMVVQRYGTRARRET